MDNPRKGLNGRNIKSKEKGMTNSHERGKAFLSESEMKVFLASAKKRRGIRNGTIL